MVWSEPERAHPFCLVVVEEEEDLLRGSGRHDEGS